MADRGDRVFDFDDFRLDLVDRLLFRGGELQSLPPKAADTLVVLVENRGHVVSKDELMRTVWADAYVEENNLSQAISVLRKVLGQSAAGRGYIETVTKRGYRFVSGAQSDAGPLTPSDGAGRAPVAPLDVDDAEPAGGAMALESAQYIVRPVDELFQAAIGRRDSIVLVKGARQMGKTSLLARGLHNARAAGSRVVLTDLQDLGSSDIVSAETLFITLGKAMSDQLDLDASPRDGWDPDDSPNVNFARFVRREVLARDEHVVWALDEVDRIFPYPYTSEVFGLFRAWHNRRALEPTGPFRKLTLAMAYATEANLFITDLNQSPFNVGTRVTLEDFTLAEVAEANRRHGSPLVDDKDVATFYALVGGQPYLVAQGLYTLHAGMPLDELVTRASSVDGPFGDHLHRTLLLVAREPVLVEALRHVLERTATPNEEAFYRLRSAGVLLGDSAYDARPRCLLYAIYLERNLPQ
ncbi:MAG TPA: AAA-like domain-containing protein [Blastocatellia bacterium]|nr:AAA-like domain-containing protein [Blastocatellia bacterium]